MLPDDLGSLLGTFAGTMGAGAFLFIIQYNWDHGI